MALQDGVLSGAQYDTVAKTLKLTFAAVDLPGPLPQEAADCQANGNCYPVTGTLSMTVNAANAATTPAYVTYVKPDDTYWKITWQPASSTWSAPVAVDATGTPLV